MERWRRFPGRTAPLEARFRELPIAWRTIEPELLTWAAESKLGAAGSGRQYPSRAKWATTPEFVQPLSYAGRVQLLAQTTEPCRCRCKCCASATRSSAPAPAKRSPKSAWSSNDAARPATSFLVSLAHGYIGYLPTPRHFALGGYETWPGTNSLEPQASVKMLDALAEMAAEIAPRSGEKKGEAPAKP